MLKVGVQTGTFFEQYDAENGARILKEAGFDCVDFGLAERFNYRKARLGEDEPQTFFEQSDEALKAYFAPHKAALEENGLTVSQVHAPFAPTYVIECEQVNEMMHNAMVKCLMLAAYLQSPYLVIHPLKLEDDPIGAQEKILNLAFYARLIPYAKQYGVKICLEDIFYTRNRQGVVTEAGGADPHDAVWYIDTLNEIAGQELFVYCFDLGHATLLGQNIRKTINALGYRLQALHLHDNDGRQDLHMQPYAYKREGYVTDWQGLIDGLRDIHFKGAISFETDCALKTLPQALRPAMAAYIASVGHYFANKIGEA